MSARFPAAFAAALLAIASHGAAAAGGGADAKAQVAQAFGNTIVSTYADGRTALLWLHADGTYSAAKGAKRKRSSGSWRLQGSKLCLKQAKPKAIPIGYCTPIPSGERWTAKSPSGKPLTLRLVPGLDVR